METATLTRVGVIGLGVMGRPMAGHILRAGHPLHVTARRPEAAAEVIESGAIWHTSARDLAPEVDVVVLMLPDLPDIEAVLYGSDGLLAGVAGTLRLIVSSTVSPDGVRQLDAKLERETDGRVRVIDAPVSGGEEGAKSGVLSIMVGGTTADAALATDVLGSCGRPVHLGPLGSGQVAKACNQLIVAATVHALGEASVIAERAGLDVAALFDLLGSGFAASRIMEVKADRFAQHDHSPSGPARFMIKDLSFATAEARRSETATPLLDVLLGTFTDLTEAGLGDADTAVIQAHIESLSPAAES